MKYEGAVAEITALHEADARADAWEAAQPHVVTVELPRDFAHDEALERLAQLTAQLLASGMPERELARRLTRYHPAMEGA